MISWTPAPIVRGDPLSWAYLPVSSGVTEQQRRWFASWGAGAVVLWASYAAILGFVFGKQFEDRRGGVDPLAPANGALPVGLQLFEFAPFCQIQRRLGAVLLVRERLQRSFPP